MYAQPQPQTSTSLPAGAAHAYDASAGSHYQQQDYPNHDQQASYTDYNDAYDQSSNSYNNSYARPSAIPVSVPSRHTPLPQPSYQTQTTGMQSYHTAYDGTPYSHDDRTPLAPSQQQQYFSEPPDYRSRRSDNGTELDDEPNPYYNPVSSQQQQPLHSTAAYAYTTDRSQAPSRQRTLSNGAGRARGRGMSIDYANPTQNGQRQQGYDQW